MCVVDDGEKKKGEKGLDVTNSKTRGGEEYTDT